MPEQTLLSSELWNQGARCIGAFFHVIWSCSGSWSRYGRAYALQAFWGGFA